MTARLSASALALVCALALQMPLPAAAQQGEPIDPAGAINEVSGDNLTNNLVGENAGGILVGIMSGFLPLANLVGVLIIVISGLMLIISQDENQLSTARKTLGAVVGALVLINVAPALTNSLVTAFGTDRPDWVNNGTEGAAILSDQILGLVEFVEVPLAAIAVVMIIISGIRAILAFGTDEGYSIMRRTILAVSAGIVLILAKVALTTAIGANPYDVFIVGTPDSHPFIGIVRDMLFTVLSFMALAAVVMIVIAGVILIANKGDQEVVEKARGLVIRTLIGLLVILVSGSLVMVVLG